MKIKLYSIIHNDIINEPYNFISKVIFTNNTTNDCIIDHVDQKWIILYVIPNFEYVDTAIYKIADNWYITGYDRPVSIAFEQLGAKHLAAPLLKKINLKNIQQIDGPIFSHINNNAIIKKASATIIDKY
jgi:hypothetical protein